MPVVVVVAAVVVVVVARPLAVAEAEADAVVVDQEDFNNAMKVLRPKSLKPARSNTNVKMNSSVVGKWQIKCLTLMRGCIWKTSARLVKSMKFWAKFRTFTLPSKWIPAYCPKVFNPRMPYLLEQTSCCR